MVVSTTSFRADMPELVFLGTGAAVPDKHSLRYNVATWLSYSRKCRILVDCGEGAKYQLCRAGLSRRIHYVFLTHEHYDHMMGLTGVLAMLSQVSSQQTGPAVRIYGPPLAIDRAESLVRLGRSKPGATLHLALSYHQLAHRASVDLGIARVTAFRTQHHAWPSLGYVFEQDGPHPNKIVFLGDTRILSEFLEVAGGALCLIVNANFAGHDAALAAEHGHTTSLEAARLARDAGVGRLFIQHLSPRYRDETDGVLAEARAVFPQTVLLRDLDSVTLEAGRINTGSQRIQA